LDVNPKKLYMNPKKSKTTSNKKHFPKPQKSFKDLSPILVCMYQFELEGGHSLHRLQNIPTSVKEHLDLVKTCSEPKTGWWFGTCFFPYIGNNNPNSNIFHRG
jgi:hypothetical protein